MVREPSRCLLAICLLMLAAGSSAGTLYKYRGENGEWVFTDRRPAGEDEAEVRQLDLSFIRPTFTVSSETVGTNIEFTAHNDFYAPIEMRLEILEIVGVQFPHPDNELRWVIPARSEQVLLTLEFLQQATAPHVRYRYHYLPGDPAAEHRMENGYQVPFSAAQSFPVTQSYPDIATHRSLDSVRAVDIAMPVGTDILASRGGIVFDVASKNFRGGLDEALDGPAANIVRILHDDGTFSLYAHLNWNTIRVKPGDRVVAGQYIADSGNTGFSSGPHLHFAVLKNAGFRIESLPINFQTSNGTLLTPVTGEVLTGFR